MSQIRLCDPLFLLEKFVAAWREKGRRGEVHMGVGRGCGEARVKEIDVTRRDLWTRGIGGLSEGDRGQFSPPSVLTDHS